MKTVPFKVVDSHLHFWDPAKLEYPWLSHVPLIAGRHTPEELLNAFLLPKDFEAVFVQAECKTEQAIEEVAWVTELSKKYPWIKGIVAYAPMNQGDKTVKHLESLDSYSLVKGIRHHLQTEADASFCWRPDFIQGIQSLVPLHLTFDLCVIHHQLPEAMKLVEKCPENQFVLDHFGNASLKDNSFDQWERDLRAIARFENVSVKLSGLLTQLPPEPDSRQISSVFKIVFEAFGPHRALFGSDWPVLNLNGNYDQWLDLVLQETSLFSDAEKQAIFAGNAKQIYRLPRN